MTGNIEITNDFIIVPELEVVLNDFVFISDVNRRQYSLWSRST